MLIKGSSSSCDHCNIRKATVCSKNHVARLCVPCDMKLHSHETTEDNHSRFLLCHNCRLGPAVIQCFDQGLLLCQTCVSGDVNPISRFYRYNCPLPRDLDPDSSSSSSSSCLIDPSSRFPFGSSLPPPNNRDSSLSPSSGMMFQNFDTYTNNYSDYIQPVPMLHPDLLDILKDSSSCSGFDGFKTKEEIENVLLNSPEGDGVVLDCFSGEDSILTNHFIMDELRKITGTMTEVIPLSSSPLGIHKDYNINQALASCNASPQDYNKNQMIGSSKLGKEDTMTNNNLGMFHNSLVQIDCGQSQLILTDEMLPWDDQTLVSAVYNPLAREEAKKRYFAKKMKRKFGKQIRYESRKSTADTKRRMKGRFTKAGAEYDYDPRANNTDKEMNKIMMT